MVKEDLINQEEALEGLEMLIEHFYGEDALKALTVKNMTDLAFRLARVVNKQPPWGWRYITNLRNKAIEPSKILRRAVQILCLALDDVPELLTKSKDITGLPLRVLVSESLEPGTVIMLSSQRCRRAGCVMSFTRRGPNHKFCSPECRKKVRVMKGLKVDDD